MKKNVLILIYSLSGLTVHAQDFLEVLRANTSIIIGNIVLKPAGVTGWTLNNNFF